MAKGKDGDKGKAKKAKIAKFVGQVKVSKKLRKAGEKMREIADQPIVSNVVAAAMMAAAAALAENKGEKRSAKKSAGVAAGTEAGKLADSLRALALDVARRTLESWEPKSGTGKSKGARPASRA